MSDKWLAEAIEEFYRQGLDVSTSPYNGYAFAVYHKQFIRAWNWFLQGSKS